MPPLRIGAYLRVSTDDQVNVFEGSLDSQKYRTVEFVRFKNSQSLEPWGEIVDYYVEEGVSAGTTNRPEYQRLMADIRKGRVNMILVSDLTRLSRNLLDFCNLIKELEAHKASYHSMKEQFDTSTPIGRMIVYIIIALGQFERETTSERVSMNCHTRAVKGFLNGGPAPLGYDKHSEKKGTLVINEEEAEVVRSIFRIFLEEGSRSRTIPRLHAERILPKRTSKRAEEQGPADWTVQSLGSILQNAAYIGMREVNKVYKDEDPNHLKPWQRHQMVKASWPAIVNEEIFFDAQKLLEEASLRERARIGKGERRPFLLTGLLTCGETGLPLLGQTGKGRTGTIHRYYHYSRTPKGMQNIRPRLRADDLEEVVIGRLRNALVSQGYLDNLAKSLKAAYEAAHQGKASEQKRLMKALADVQTRTSAIWHNQSRMQLSEEALRQASEELNKLAQERLGLENALKQLGPITDEGADIATQVLFVENQIRACMMGWAKSSPAVRKRLLRRTIKEIVVTRDELFLTYWTNASERYEEPNEGFAHDPHEGSNIVPLPRRSSSAGNRNLPFFGSGDVRNGRGCRIRTCGPAVMSGLL